MSEPVVRQLSSLEKSLLEAIRALHKDLMASNKVIKSLPETLETGFETISKNLQDQIEFWGELEVTKSQAKYLSKKNLLDEELDFLERKKNQLKEDMERQLTKYIENQRALDKQASERIKEVDSHVYEILDCDYKKGIKNAHRENDLVFDEIMEILNFDVLKKRKKVIREITDEQKNVFKGFVEKRKTLKDKLEKVKSQISTTEKIELHIPFYILKFRDSDGNAELKIFMPSKLVKITNGRGCVKFGLEKPGFLASKENEILNKMSGWIDNLKYKLKKISSSEPLIKGVKELNQDDFFSEKKEKLFSVMENFYEMRRP